MALIFHGILPFLFCYIFLITSPMGFSLPDYEALIRLKKSFTNSTGIDSWREGTEPCGGNKPWVGLNCDKGLVNVIRLEDMGMSGKIDVDALVEMEGLRAISFRNNLFSGLIPEFNKLGALRAIFLSSNRFSGEIPSDFFEKMGSLRKVWLEDNNFTGKIPASLANLSNLTELHLEGNHFSGRIPSLEQSSLDSLDLSSNRLEGEIPPSLTKFNATSFQGNSGLCGVNIGKKCQQAEATGATNKQENNSDPQKNSSKSIAIGLMTTAIAILAIMIMAILVLQRKQKNFKLLEKESLDGSVEVGVARASSRWRDTGSNRKGYGSSKKGSISHRGGPGDLVLINEDKGVFGLTDLMKAGAEVLGNGTLGSSYKAMMSNEMTVVVKRIKDMNKMGRDGFDGEITRLGRLRHPNVLAPIAYHYRKEEKLLVSEYAPKGNLLYLLHGDRGPGHGELNWPTRLKIVGGIARGLSYLHTELASIGLPHGNLKSSNVLLANGFEPLLVDYGFSPFLSLQQATQALHAYKSPEAAHPHQISSKSDIYCLGMIIIEILTGKFPYLNSGKGGIDIVQWVKSAVSERRESEVLDPEILSNGNAGEVERLLHVGAACVESSLDQRPDIREVLSRIEEIEGENQVMQGSHASTVQAGGYGGLSGRRFDSFGARSDRRKSNSFAFDIS